MAAPGAVGRRARMLCGAAAFFFISFVFAYFYLRSLDTNNDWKIGSRQPAHRSRRGDRRGVLLLSAVGAAAGGNAIRDGESQSGAGGARCSALLVDRAPGDRLVDARLRPVKRRLRQRVHRLDRVLRGVRARLRVSGSRPRWRPPGAGVAARACWSSRHAADVRTDDGRRSGRAGRLLVLLERSTSFNGVVLFVLLYLL